MPVSIRQRVRVIILGTETPAGRAFDIVLLWAIVFSVLAVMLQCVDNLRSTHGAVFVAVEWFFTILFTIEYVLRLCSVKQPAAYARSFFGLVDLMSILPTYLSVALPGAQSLLVVRSLRLLRVFRVLKLTHFLGEARARRDALVFLVAPFGRFLRL